jgi:hypothetical protein
MRAHLHRTDWFFAGFAAGLAATAGAFVVIEAVVRRRQIASEPLVRIDGVRQPDRAALGARPQEEANSAPERLESEAPDILAIEERW